MVHVVVAFDLGVSTLCDGIKAVLLTELSEGGSKPSEGFGTRVGSWVLVRIEEFNAVAVKDGNQALCKAVFGDGLG